MRCELISEIASNHGGDLDLACDLIRQCAEAGADTVKVQSYQTRHLNPADPQFAWLRQAEISDDAHVRLKACCEANHVRFLTTVFHEDRVPFLASLGLTHLKIGSGEAMRRPLIDAVAAYPWHVYVSTGLATLNEIAYAVKMLGNRLTLMHTVSEYPTPLERVNLPRIAWLREKFGVPVGYSDHTQGRTACNAALYFGVAAIEKHLTRPLRNGGVRENVWDACPNSFTVIRMDRDQYEQMMKPHPMDHDRKDRPYVGRWAYGE
jgi:N,N'-diacetyllegionaminate synthase